MAGPRRVVVLTRSGLRHDFFRVALAARAGIDLVRTYREGEERSVERLVQAAGNPAEETAHLEARARSEEDFFGSLVRFCPDESRPTDLPYGAINDDDVVREIIHLAPELIVAYGCSLVEPPLIEAFRGRFLNVHLGLSPYYRGSGTNFWAMVDQRLECVGATFMQMDEGVDTGPILHQVRARVHSQDTAHSIGNRLIADMTAVYAHLVERFDQLAPPTGLPVPAWARYFRRADFDGESVARLRAAFAAGIVDRHLAEREAREAAVPIVRNAAMEDVA